MRSPKRSPLPAITGVRILLALWVVVLHMTSFSPSFAAMVHGSPSFVQDSIESGAAAVGVFFVLSGFVLAYNYDLSATWSMPERAQFWIARFARIYPVYALALVLGIPSLIAGALKSGPLHPVSLMIGATAVLGLVQSWIPQDAMFWGGPAWSLSVEAFFYLTFPFLGRRLWKIESRRGQLMLLAGLWLWMSGVAYCLAAWKAPFFLGHATVTDTNWSAVIKFNPAVRLPEFLAGIVLCKLFLALERRPTALLGEGRGTWLYLIGLGVGLGVIGEEHLLPPAVLHNGLLLPATCAIILGLSFGGGAVWRWLSHPVAVVLGQASYSMYLLHMPLYSYFAAANKHLGHSEVAAWASLLLYLAVLFTLCCVTFFKLEEPARKAILGRFFSLKSTQRSILELQPVDADPL